MLPNSPDVNFLEYLRIMLEYYKTFHPKAKNSDGLKKVLQLTWGQLPQNSVNKAILSFTKRHRGRVRKRVRHLEHALRESKDDEQVTVRRNFEIWNKIL